MAIFLISLVIIASAGGLFWMLRSTPQPARRHGSRVSAGHTAGNAPESAPLRPGGIDKLRSTGRFWGVEMGTPGCEAAHELLGRQYTFDEAPDLPLPGCNSANCTCQFNGLAEHRGKHRRTHEDRRKEIRFDKDHPERRSRKNRRRSEKWNDHSY